MGRKSSGAVRDVLQLVATLMRRLLFPRVGFTAPVGQTVTGIGTEQATVVDFHGRQSSADCYQYLAQYRPAAVGLHGNTDRNANISGRENQVSGFQCELSITGHAESVRGVRPVFLRRCSIFIFNI